MYKIIFDTVAKKPFSNDAEANAECDRLQRCVRDACNAKSSDEFKARQWLLSQCRRCDPKLTGFLSPDQFQAVLKLVNIVNTHEMTIKHWVSRFDRRDQGVVDYKAFVAAVFGDAKDAAPLALPECRKFLETVRDSILGRGSHSMFGLSRSFRIMDSNHNQKLSHAEFRDGLARYGIDVSDEATMKTVLAAFDPNNDGIDITEFLVCLRGQLNDYRYKLVELAFQQLDRDRSGVVEFAEVCRLYDVSRHPDVSSKRRSPEAVMLEFIRSWDRDGDGTITLPEFVDYYKTLSCSIDRDDYFELMIRNAWHLAGGEGWSANTSNLRVLVVHNDGLEEVVCIQNDLGIRPKDEAKIRTALAEQGVQDVRRVAIAF